MRWRSCTRAGSPRHGALFVRDHPAQNLGVAACAAGLSLVGAPTWLEGGRVLGLSRHHAVMQSDLVALALFLSGLVLLRGLLSVSGLRALCRHDPDAASLLVLGVGLCATTVDLGHGAAWLSVIGGGLFAAGALRAVAAPSPDGRPRGAHAGHHSHPSGALR